MYNQDKFIEILKKCLRDYSLNEYSRIAGVDAGYISRILNKKRKNPPSPSVLKKIAELFFDKSYICSIDEDKVDDYEGYLDISLSPEEMSDLY